MNKSDIAMTDFFSKPMHVNFIFNKKNTVFNSKTNLEANYHDLKKINLLIFV